MTKKTGTVFSGVGTPEYALKQLGIDHENTFMCDNDKYARQTYLANHNVQHVFEDITAVDFTPFKDTIDLYIGGSPCQSFSIAGKRGGFEDTRGTLFYEFARGIKEMQPRVFIWENVKGVLSHDKGMTFKTICNTFIDLGYYSTYKVLNTKDYGIPQNRERIFVVGFKSFEDYNNFEFPQPLELKLRLRDMLEADVPDKYYLSEKALSGLQNILERSKENNNGWRDGIIDTDGVCNTVDGNYYKGADGKRTLIRWQNSKDGIVQDDCCPSLRSSGGTDIRKRPAIIEKRPPHHGKLYKGQ